MRILSIWGRVIESWYDDVKDPSCYPWIAAKKCYMLENFQRILTPNQILENENK